ncbi:hypothetical protein E6H24_02800 [Candidatus Bathyarchaeota archaeon]|nr:MAG: hypothetical protein E6H24_02800 [Candidatus Bathyarchaeota archaeon]
MMNDDTRIHELSKVMMKEPVLIQGLPGLGYVGKVAVDYFIEKLKPKKFAELYSSYLLFPDGNLGINISEDGTYSLPKYVGDAIIGERLKKLGAKLARGGAVTGAAGVILGIGRQRGLQCAGLLGATTGVYPDLEAARAVIQMLTGLVTMPVELKDLDTEIEDMRKKMEKLRRTDLEESKEGEEEKPEEGKDRYIT